MSAITYAATATCNDDHSSSDPRTGRKCPKHGYDPSVPAPLGFRWIDTTLPDGQVYTGLAPDVPTLTFTRTTA